MLFRSWIVGKEDVHERAFTVIGANAITPGAEVVRTAAARSARKRLGRGEVDVMVMNTCAADESIGLQ